MLILSIVKTYGIKLLLVFLIFGCSQINKSQKPQEDKTALVFLEKAIKKQNSDVTEVPALVLSQVNASLKTNLSGTVVRIIKNLGQRVQGGDAILEIRHNDPAFEYRPFFLRASISGRISEINVALGSLVQVSDVLARIIDEKSVELHVQLPGRDLNRLPELDKVFWVNDPSFELKVNQLSPSLNIETGTAPAVFTFKGSKYPKDLKIGSISQIRLTFKAKSSIWVNAESVVYRQEKSFVRKINDGKIKWTEVKLGEQLSDKIEILDGVQDQEAIVMRSSRYVAEGEVVKVFDEKTQTDGIAR